MPLQKQISESISSSSPLSIFNYDKPPINFLIIELIGDPVVGYFGLSIAKYTKEYLQKIFKIVLRAQISSFNKPCKKLLKAISSDIYYSKSYIEYYNFY